MKRWRTLLWIFLGMMVLLGGLSAWLLHTGSGLRFAVARAQGALPELSIGRASGSIAGGIEVENLRYRNATIDIQLKQAHADLRVLSVLTGEPDLDRLQLTGLHVHLLPVATASASTPAEPARLPALRVRELQADDISITRGSDEPLQWQSVKASMQMSDTTIALSELRVQHEQYALNGDTIILPNDAWLIGDSDLRLQTTAAAADPIQARLRRSSAKLGAPIRIEVKQPLDIVAELRPGKKFEQFELALKLPEQDAAALGLGPEYPLAAELEIVRTGDAFQLSGALSLGTHRARIEPAQLRLQDSALLIESLPVQLADAGTISVQGRLPFAQNEDLRLLLETQSLTLLRAGEPPLLLSGSLEATGTYAEPTLKPALRIEQEGLPPGHIDGQVSMTASAIQFDALRLSLPRGTLEVDGSLSRDQAAVASLELVLADFDPSQLLADWPGALNGKLHWQGSWSEQGASGVLEISSLSGRLREQPVQAQGQVELLDSKLRSAEIQATFAEARLDIAGDISGPQPLRLDLDIPDLASIDASAGGRLQMKAERDQRWTFELSANALSLDDFALATLSAAGSAGLTADDSVSLQAEFSSLQRGDLVLDQGTVQVDGTQGEHALKMNVTARQSQLQLDATGGWSEARWEGVIDHADLLLSQDRALKLQQPLSLIASEKQLSISPSCWSGSDEAHLCIDGELIAGTGAFTVDLGKLPLNWANDWLVGTGYSLDEAVLQGTARVAFKDYHLISANADLRSQRGLLRLAERADLVLGYQSLQVQTEFADGSGVASLSTDLLPEGHAEAAFEYQWDETGNLTYDGSISALIRELDAIEAFTTEIANPSGLVTGQFRLQQDQSGFRAGGSMTLSNFKADVPGLGLKLSEGSVALAGVPDGLILRGAVKSGDGSLTIDGRWSHNADEGLTLSIGGENVRLSNTPELNLVATPDLKLNRDRDGWNLTGTIDIPRARILADQLGTTSVQSNDVIVIDDAVQDAPDERWRARVLVRMGDDVQLKGFGFDGSLRGQLNVRQSSGRSAIATGQLNVTGDYTAYGQELVVKSGELLYAGSPLDEPSVRVRAEREIGERTAGVEITGTARKLSSRVYARPELSESEALSLLVTGRSLGDVRGGDQNKLSVAALALGTIGGDMLAKNLGLDELGVSSNSGLAGQAFTIGKYLSPRIYVGYGIGLLNRGEIFTVRYQINKRIEVEVNIGERQRAALNYRIER